MPNLSKEEKVFSYFATKSGDDLYKDFASSPKGLKPEVAEKLLKEFGPNEIRSAVVNWWRILLRQFKSPFLYLLIAAAALALLLGEKTDAIMIIGFVGLDVIIGFCQEYHSERAVLLLKKMVSTKVLVRRGGKEFLVNSHELVPGDLVVVRTGDCIQADLRWLEVDDLQIDESTLTGESEVSLKSTKSLKDQPLDFGSAKNIGFSGTVVASGCGVGLVFATGIKTEFGRIAKLTTETDTPGTFEKGIAQFSSFILRVILVTLGLVFLANLLVKGFQVNIPDLLIFSVALAVSVIPEALPVVTTMTLSRGALRMAKKKVVAKRLSSIEDLGSIDVLCTDKTGTITENKMTVAEILAEDKDKCLWYANLAAPAVDPKISPLRSNFDGALSVELSEDSRLKVFAAIRRHEAPFDPVKRFNQVEVKDGGQFIFITRGAPEAVLALCEISKEEEKTILTSAKKEGVAGRRVLAIACKKNKVWEFVGLISFFDPIKKTAKAAIVESERLGLKIKILTGDGPEVAGAIGYEIGLIKSPSQVITGDDWEKLPATQRSRVAEKEMVFARVSPEQKFLIIQALQKKFEVGFLGEGINDAPALKIADVGLVVDGASDIAREAADLVLLDHGLEVIVSGIKEGREIFANTIKYIKSTLTSNFGNFVAVAAATLLINYLPMLPVQLLLLNLLSDFPMIAIALDSVDPEELKRPRHYDVKEVALVALVLGLISTIFDFIFFALFSQISPEVLWTNWFIASVLTELALTMSIRTKKPFFMARAPAPILLILTFVGSAAAILIPFTSFGQSFFSFVTPKPIWLLVIVSLVILYFVITEIVKHFYYKFVNVNGNSVHAISPKRFSKI